MQRPLVDFMNELNALAASIGFMRINSNDFTFKRSVEDGCQRLFLGPEKPIHADGEEVFRVYPVLQLCFPNIRKVVKQLLKDSPWVGMESDLVVLTEPLDAVIPIRDRIKLRFADSESAGECCGLLRQQFKKWVMPFLDEYSTCSALIDGYYKKDARIVIARPFHLNIVAAHLVCGEVNQAMELLSSVYKSPAMRREYDSAFKSLANWHSS